ncbi:ABC transporter ATP-binding protein, partial [Streptomyces sp. NPDC001339]
MAEQDNGAGPAPDAGRVPTVIADDLHIVYRVYGGGAGKGSATAALNRIIRR